MDTTLLFRPKNDKTTSNVVGISIALIILISQNLNISAKDLNIGINTGISPNINYIKEEQENREKEHTQLLFQKYRGKQFKEIDKGICHIKTTKYYNGKPVKLNIVEICTSINPNLTIKPSVAEDTLLNRTKITNIAKKRNALVAINGGYFKPQTGVPLGTLMINKKIYTGPIYDRVALGFFNNGYEMARVKLDIKLNTNKGGFKIDNINQPRMLSTHTIVYTRDWGQTSPITPKYGTQLVIRKGKLVGVSDKSVEIPGDGFVIIGPLKYLEPITKAKHYKLSFKTTPEWKNVNHIISGGPYLVKDNNVYIDTTEERLSAIGGRNPRTAIGYTKDNHLIMVTADGREGASIGLTLEELAKLMKELGCINAMNLDGGGSTVMYIQGEIVNKPAVSGGIPLSNSITVSQKDLL